MIGAKIGELEMMEAWYEDDPTMRVRVNFPFYVGTGTKSSAVVYFELEGRGVEAPGPTLTAPRRSSWSCRERPRPLWARSRGGSPLGRWR